MFRESIRVLLSSDILVTVAATQLCCVLRNDTRGKSEPSRMLIAMVDRFLCVIGETCTIKALATGSTGV